MIVNQLKDDFIKLLKHFLEKKIHLFQAIKKGFNHIDEFEIQTLHFAKSSQQLQ